MFYVQTRAKKCLFYVIEFLFFVKTRAKKCLFYVIEFSFYVHIRAKKTDGHKRLIGLELRSLNYLNTCDYVGGMIIIFTDNIDYILNKYSL